MPLVSVVIPTYNCEAYIRETIDSVLAQEFQNIEIIVVDDGSTDRTVDFVRSYGHSVRFLSQENSGVCVARNRGLREAAGKYICFMDHDDYWYPGKISRQVEEFGRHPEVGVVYSAFTLWTADASGNFARPASLYNSSIADDIDSSFSGWIYHLLLLDCWVLTSTAMFRAEVLRKCGAFDEGLPYSEDWDLWIRISREYQFLKLRQSTTLYRQHMLQGNRKVRSIDYRTTLLSRAAKQWGLSSPDGQCVSRWRFQRQLAEYHACFGLHHLQAGIWAIAMRSLFKAWVTYPVNVKYLAYIPATWLGWSPRLS
jgi:glycosyltransferase involved in cell wall biosynthesis